MADVVLVYAFEPVPELDGRAGILALESLDADLLIAALRVELIEPHCNEAMRYVEGSEANIAARDALAAQRKRLTTPRTRKTKQEA